MLILDTISPAIFFVPENQWVAFFATHKKEFKSGNFVIVVEKH